MTSGRNATRKTIIGLLLAGIATATLPGVAAAQDDEARLRRLEAEIRALQRAVFPGGDGRYFTPEVDTSQGAQRAQPVGTPSNSALTDILARLDALEAQLATMSSREEENANEIAQLRSRLDEALGTAGRPASGAAQPTGVIPLPQQSQGAAPAPRTAAAAPTPAPARSSTPAPSPAAPGTSTPARTAAPATSPARGSTPAPSPARTAGATSAPAASGP